MNKKESDPELKQWVAITGGSDGIGRALAFAMARRGFNIAILARNPEKMEKVEKEIRLTSGVDVKCIPIDFSKATTEQYSAIYDTLD